MVVEIINLWVVDYFFVNNWVFCVEVIFGDIYWNIVIVCFNYYNVVSQFLWLDFLVLFGICILGIMYEIE